MISLVNAENTASFKVITQMADPFACKISAQFSAIGLNNPSADFWLCEDVLGNSWGAICRTGKGIMLYMLSGADYHELAYFLQMIGQGITVSASLAVCKRIGKAFPFTQINSGNIMLCQNLIMPQSKDIVQNSEDYKAVYLCICQSDSDFAFGISFDDFYADIFPKKKQAHCFFVEIRKNNEIGSVAGALHMSPKVAVIGCVSTVPSLRKRGYATQTVAEVSKHILNSKRIPTLLCKKELACFYERLGFIKAGEWGEILIKEPF